ncbi:MAG: FixH family protein [Betaproteobacteria bacterium]|nr:FixH family protein [Betaproteobacteria bacterium]MDH4324326.1 FixH family protein [Betaproteobacteria bacterium]
MAKAALLLIVLALPLLAQAQTPEAQLRCESTGQDFVYDCTLMLTRFGRPLEGAQVTVGADMPSMPMAHSVRPARARPGLKPGEYKARLDLEMLGEWAIKLRLDGPVRDLLVLHYEFDSKGAMPRKR